MTDIAERHCYQNHPCTGLQSRRTALRRTVLSGGSIAGDFQRIARLDSRSRISDDLKPDAIADRLRHKLDRRGGRGCGRSANRSEEHTSELPSLMRTSYAVFCLKKKK